jgi:hypothetical protein
MTGAARSTRSVRVADSVTSPLADCRERVSVIVPATVPVCSAIWLVEKAAVVLPAGIVKLTVRPPVGNWMAASSIAI